MTEEEKSQSFLIGLVYFVVFVLVGMFLTFIALLLAAGIRWAAGLL